MEIVGVDPGLVHTGVVMMRFLGHVKGIEVMHEAVAGPDAPAVQKWVFTHKVNPNPLPTFIEDYRPRSAFNTDKRMGRAVSEMKAVLGYRATVLDNTGVVKIVRRPLMELLGVWNFSTPTHHQDLRSAARIALLGMLRDEEMNLLLSNVVADHLKGRTWNVTHLT